jgi:large subunit ribosomal protein L21
MYAVIRTGGKQYKVATGGLVEVGKLAGAKGDSVAFDDVLMVGGGGGDDPLSLGAPLVVGASVAGEIVEQKRGDKILVFKKRRRQNSKRSRGHRQDYTLVRITEILTDGKKARKSPAAKPTEAGAAAEAVEAAAKPAEAKAARPKRAAPKKAKAASESAAGAKPARKPRAKAAKAEDKG